MTGGELRCAAIGTHGGAPRRERPEAAYMVMANPCHAHSCEGRICTGHPVCPVCAAGIRAGKTKWVEHGETTEAATLWSIPAASRVRQVGA